MGEQAEDYRDQDHQDDQQDIQDRQDQQDIQGQEDLQDQVVLQDQQGQQPVSIEAGAMTEEEAKQYIKEEKEAQNARRMGGHSDGHNMRIFAIVSAHMNKEPNKTFKMDVLEIAVQVGGHKFSNTGPAMAYAVRAGLVERVGRGFYRLLPAGRNQ